MTDHVEATRQGAGLRLRDNSDDERRRAALYVCGRSVDAADARELLQALGLMPAGVKWTRSIHTHTRRRKVANDG